MRWLFIHFFAFPGIYSARYKWSPRFLGEHGWLEVHRFMIICGVIIFASSGLIALIKFGDAYSPVGKTHSWFALLLLISITIQVLMGTFRPAPSSRYRPMFGLVHMWLGRVLVLAAFVTICLGVAALREKLLVTVSRWVSPSGRSSIVVISSRCLYRQFSVQHPGLGFLLDCDVGGPLITMDSFLPKEVFSERLGVWQC